MTESVEHCKTEFERGRRLRPHEPMRLNDLRWQALERFLSLGFPPGRAASAAGAHLFTLGTPPTGRPPVGAIALDLPEPSLNLLFVNGCWAGDRPFAPAAEGDVLVAGASDLFAGGPFDIEPYFARLCLFDNDPFAALNTALFADACCIIIPSQTSVERAIHVQFVATGEADLRPAMTHPRLLIVLGAAARATVIEVHSGPPDGRHLTNGVTEVFAADGARLEYHRIQRDSPDAYHFGRIGVHTGQDAECMLHTVNEGASMAETTLTIERARSGPGFSQPGGRGCV
jgi:Fe-S cluster assembly protein SufD